jgi:hypothetical protein
VHYPLHRALGLPLVARPHRLRPPAARTYFVAAATSSTSAAASSFTRSLLLLRARCGRAHARPPARRVPLARSAMGSPLSRHRRAHSREGAAGAAGVGRQHVDGVLTLDLRTRVVALGLGGVDFRGGQLHSIPEARATMSHAGLVTSELVCGAPRMEVPMGNLVKRSSRRVMAWLGKHHVALVVLLSLLHIGLSCIHARDSGGADCHACSAAERPPR